MKHVSLPKMLLILLVGISAFLAPWVALTLWAQQLGLD